jgi:hypothetical protein
MLWEVPTSVFYCNTVGRNVSVVSEKLLSQFYALKRIPTKRIFLSFEVHIQLQNKTPFILYFFLLKINFNEVYLLPLDTPDNFLNKCPPIIHPWLQVCCTSWYSLVKNTFKSRNIICVNSLRMD